MNGMRLMAIAFLFIGLAFSQATEVVLSQGAPNTAYSSVYGYSGSNLIYLCTARSVVTQGTRPSLKVAISAATNASPVVFTSVGHGFPISSRPKITITGATGNWTPVNIATTATVIDADTFSIVVDSTAFGALTGTLVFTTTAPRITIAEWAVELLVYSGSNPIWKGWLAGSSSYAAKCSDAALTTTNIQ